jgi:hypothetical protein
MVDARLDQNPDELLAKSQANPMQGLQRGRISAFWACVVSPVERLSKQPAKRTEQVES